VADRLRPPREDLRTRILNEIRRQGVKAIDLSAGAMLRLTFCVARRSATESFPVAVASCLGQKASQMTVGRVRRTRYRKLEILAELRRQQVDVTNASAGWMMRFMACVSAQVLSQSLPNAVQSCLLRQANRLRPRWSRRGRF
jgi:hypothetical protein